MERTKAFSLVELTVALAVIAIVAGITSLQIFGMIGASRKASDKQNVSVWNAAYSNAFAAQTILMSTYTTWDSASEALAKGVQAPYYNDFDAVIRAPVPEFHDKRITTDYAPFVVGQGIVLPGDY
jgi:prepilin-type N-terminal cleavage/methylation domain-containing protein